MKTIEEAVLEAAKAFESLEDFEYECERAEGLSHGLAVAYGMEWTIAYGLIKEHLEATSTRHGRAKVLLDKIHTSESNDEELSLYRELVDLLLEALYEGDECHYDEWGELR